MHCRTLFLLLTLALVGCGPVNGQDDGLDRREQIRMNLQVHFPQLQDYEVTVEPLEDSGIDGVDRGTFTINGQQTQAFLVTEDNTQLYLIGGDPVDVSMSAEEIEAELAAQAEAEAAEANERHEALMAALPDLPTQGPADAPVTIVEFSDFQCPYCARGTQTLDQLLALHPEDVRVVFAHYPLPNHDWARPAAIASQCAYDQSQEAFWTLHDAYFQNQRRFSKDEIVSQSREVLADTGIDLEAWSTCAGDPSSESYQAAAETVDETLEIGSEFGVSGTPGFFINGFFLNGAQPLEAFERTIEQAQNTSP